jgi:hypothetical protein
MWVPNRNKRARWNGDDESELAELKRPGPAPAREPLIVFPRSAASAGSVPDACRGRMCALAQPRARAAAQPRPRQPPERSPSPRAPPGSTPSMCWPRRARWARSGSRPTWERRRCPRCRSSPPTSPSRSSTSRTPRHARARPSASPAPRRDPQRHRCTRTLRPQASAAWPPCACWRSR